MTYVNTSDLLIATTGNKAQIRLGSVDSLLNSIFFDSTLSLIFYNLTLPDSIDWAHAILGGPHISPPLNCPYNQLMIANVSVI